MEELWNQTFGGRISWLGRVPLLKKLDLKLRRRLLDVPRMVATNTNMVLSLIYNSSTVYSAQGSFKDIRDLGILYSDPSFVWWALKITNFLTEDFRRLMTKLQPNVWNVLKAAS